MKDYASDNTIAFDQQQNNFYNLKKPFLVDNQSIIDGNNLINGLQIFNYYSKNHFKKILGITKDEFNLITELINTESLTLPKLFFYIENDDYILSDGNIKFKKYVLKVLAEKSNNELIVYETAQEIIIYTIDTAFYFSQNYAEHMYMSNLNSSSIIDYTIKEN